MAANPVNQPIVNDPNEYNAWAGDEDIPVVHVQGEDAPAAGAPAGPLAAAKAVHAGQMPYPKALAKLKSCELHDRVTIRFQRIDTAPYKVQQVVGVVKAFAEDGRHTPHSDRRTDDGRDLPIRRRENASSVRRTTTRSSVRTLCLTQASLPISSTHGASCWIRPHSHPPRC